MTRPETILHLGAHRTGTTTLQSVLDAAASALAVEGVVTLTPPRPGRRDHDVLRSIVKDATRADMVARVAHTAFPWRGPRGKLEELIASAASDCVAPLRRVILSDETLLGPAFRRNGDAIYPRAELRLSRFRRTCLAEVDEVHLTLRSYDSFLVSAFAMRAVYAGRMPAFSSIRSSLVHFRTGWCELIDQVRGIYPKARVLLTCFEDSDIGDRLRSLVGPTGVDLSEYGIECANRAPTLDAIQHVQGLGRRPFDPDEIVQRFSDGVKFDPLTPTEKQELHERYHGDLRALRGREDVIFVATA